MTPPGSIAIPENPDHRVEELGHELMQLKRSQAVLRAVMSQLDPDSIEWSAHALLTTLVAEGPQRPSELAESSCLDPSTISRQVSYLQRRGLAERQPDPEDGRAYLLLASDTGRQAHARMKERRHRALARLVADWPEGDLQRLTELLAQFNESLTNARIPLLADLAERGSLKEPA